MKRWQVFVGLSTVVVLMGVMLAPEAYSDDARPGRRRGGTDFDALQRDQFTEREDVGRKPKGWVGPCVKCDAGGDAAAAAAAPPASSAAPESAEALGGGDTPVIRDVALPPEEAKVATLTSGSTAMEEEAELAQVYLEADRPRETAGAQPVLNMPTTRAEVLEEPSINPPGRDLPRAEFIDIRMGKPGAFDLEGLQGRFTFSRDDESKPTPILTQYGFASVIELKNGEKPSGGAFCGMCGPEGAFHVEALSDRVGIVPREMSSSERGVLATNLTIITDQNRALTFNVVEITGIRDRQGRPLQRTDRHEVRGAEMHGSSVVDWSFEKRVAQAEGTMRTQLEAQLEEVKERAVGEGAKSRLQTFGDFEEEKSEGGRALLIQSVVTIGDHTLIKFVIPRGTYADPVALVEGEGKKHRVKALTRRSTFSTPSVVDGEDVLVVTLEVDAVELEKGERLAVSIFDKGRGEELRSSAGRG